MPAFLFDTDTFSYLHDRRSPFHGAVRTRLGACTDADRISLSILTWFELHCAAALGALFFPFE